MSIGIFSCVTGEFLSRKSKIKHGSFLSTGILLFYRINTVYLKQSNTVLRRSLTILIFALSPLVVFSQKLEKKASLDIHHQWLEEAYTLTKNCVGFSAPVSGRAYGYFSIGMYESAVEVIPELKSLSGQLDGYNRQTWSDQTAVSYTHLRAHETQ